MVTDMVQFHHHGVHIIIQLNYHQLILQERANMFLQSIGQQSSPSDSFDFRNFNTNMDPNTGTII